MTIIPQKCCPKCRQHKPATLEFFRPDTRTKDNLSKRCIECTIKPSSDPSPDGYKQCVRCKDVFPSTLEFFYPNKGVRDGMCPLCRTCTSAYQKEKYAIKMAARVKEVPDGCKKCSQCGEIKPYTPEYFHRNGAKRLSPMCKPCRKVYADRVVSSEKRLAQSRYYEAFPERKARRKAYRETPRAKANFRTNTANRRAREKTVPGTHTAAQIREQYKRQKGKCYYCRNKVKWGEHHVDHTFPVSRVAGTGIPANSIEYLVITCRHCNTSKNDRFPWEWPEGGRLL